MYRHIGASWSKIWKERAGDIGQRVISWRRGRAVVRLERPSRIDKARQLGYKAKQGLAVVRVRVGRGGMRRLRPKSGRRPKHAGVTRMKAAISMRAVAERRAIEKFPNLKMLNSYFIYRDGKYSWYEIIMVDPYHPAIKADRDLCWISART